MNPYRDRLIEEAARLLEQELCDSPAQARARAGRRLGIGNPEHHASLEEITAALKRRLELFQGSAHQQRLSRMRASALLAMQLLQPFRPRLVGDVLDGTPSQHSAIRLHLFSDTPEAVALFLIDRKIPWRQSSIRLRFQRGRREERPLFCFIAGKQPIELVILGAEEYRNPPLSPGNDRPERGASIKQLQQLIEEGPVQRRSMGI